MTEDSTTTPPSLPDVPTFWPEMCAYLRREEPELWTWFSQNRVREEQVEAVRLALLKQTYRIERPSAPSLYEAVDSVVRKLGIADPVTFYRADGQGVLNASLAYVPGEVHIVLLGPVSEALSDAELKAVLGHELGHYLLLRQADGEYLVAGETVNAMTHNRSAEAVHDTTARRISLFTEVYADRVSLHVVGDLATVVGALVKMATGVMDADPESYLRQAGEILAAGPVKTEGITHPECYVRVEALRRWSQDGPDAEAGIAEMVRGPLDLDDLDLLGQLALAGHTRHLMETFLAPVWFHSEEVLAHARLFFEDFKPAPPSDAHNMLADEIAKAAPSVREYFCYVILDFVATGRDLEPIPLAWALELSARLGIEEDFERIARKELSLRKKQLELLRRQGPALLDKAAQQAGQKAAEGNGDAV